MMTTSTRTNASVQDVHTRDQVKSRTTEEEEKDRSMHEKESVER